MPTKEKTKHLPDLSAIYEELSYILRRMNKNPDTEDIIDFETSVGFIMKLFPGCHYKCEYEEDTYSVIEKMYFYYYSTDTEDNIDIIKTVYPAEC